MKIIKITSRHRFDFSSVMVCEHCGSHQTDPSGYDDANYYVNVIPKISCLSCKKDRDGNLGGIEKGALVKPVKTETTVYREV